MPPTVAILGASTNRQKFGNKSVRAHAHAGYVVYPVNPRADEIEGHHCYPTLAEVPEPLDRISVYLPPELAVLELESMANKHPKEVWFNPGSHSPSLLERAAKLGIPVRPACSIVDLGLSPSQFPG